MTDTRTRTHAREEKKLSEAVAGKWRCLWWFDHGHTLTAILCAPDMFQPFGDNLWIMRGQFATQEEADKTGHRFEAKAREMGLKNTIIYVRAEFFPDP